MNEENDITSSTVSIFSTAPLSVPVLSESSALLSAVLMYSICRLLQWINQGRPAPLVCQASRFFLRLWETEWERRSSVAPWHNETYLECVTQASSVTRSGGGKKREEELLKGGAEFAPQSHTLSDPLVSVILSPRGFRQWPGWQASWFSGFQMLNTIYKERGGGGLLHTLTHSLWWGDRWGRRSKRSQGGWGWTERDGG